MTSSETNGILSILTGKLANCAILGVIGALKIALASKLQPQGANWRVMNFVIIFPFYHLFLPLLYWHFLIAEEGKLLDDFPRIANHFRYNKVTIGKKIVIS